MNVMFAENIDGWLLAAAFLFGGLGASVIALVGIIPAWRGNIPITVFTIAPAIFMFGLATFWLGQGFLQDPKHDREEFLLNTLQPWLVMALPSLLTSAGTAAVLCLRRRKLALGRGNLTGS